MAADPVGPAASAEGVPVVHSERREAKHDENGGSWLGDVPQGGAVVRNSVAFVQLARDAAAAPHVAGGSAEGARTPMAASSARSSPFSSAARAREFASSTDWRGARILNTSR